MPNVKLATKTMAAIDVAMKADQGASFRVWEGRVLPHLPDAYRGEEDGFRSHMGASLMGEECGRAIWYSFRWVTKPVFDGRILRLFNRGHLEEGRFIALLLMVGIQVFQQDEHGHQYRITGSHGHYGGSGDGIGFDIPDLPKGQSAVLEFKTHNDKSFTELKSVGCRNSKFEHFVQSQQYMRKLQIPITLYCAVNKNTDELYIELLELLPDVADQFIERADKIIWMQHPPEKINKSPGWFKCKWCDHRPVCHLGAEPDRNCRTCAYSEPLKVGDEGLWACNHPKFLVQQHISKATQLVGCEHYTKKAM